MALPVENAAREERREAAMEKQKRRDAARSLRRHIGMGAREGLAAHRSVGRAPWEVRIGCESACDWTAGVEDGGRRPEEFASFSSPIQTAPY